MPSGQDSKSKKRQRQESDAEESRCTVSDGDHSEGIAAELFHECCTCVACPMFLL